MTSKSTQRLPFGAAFAASLTQDGGGDPVRRGRELTSVRELRDSHLSSSLDRRDLESLLGNAALDASRERDEPVLPVSDSFVGALGELRDSAGFRDAAGTGAFDRTVPPGGDTVVSPAGAGFSAALGGDGGLRENPALAGRADSRGPHPDYNSRVPDAEIVDRPCEPVTLRDLASVLDRHPEGQAVLEQLREICGAVPGNVAVLQELSNYVNRPPWEQPRQLLGGGAVVGTGDVTGPSTSTDNAIARYDGTTGKVIQNSAVRIDDSGNMEGGANLTISGQLRSGDGDATKPGQAFKGDDGTGMFRGSTPALGFSVGGSQQLLLRGHHGLDHILTGNTTLQGDLLIDGDVTADNLTLTNPLPITQGGTGASTADGAIQNLTNGATSRTPVLTDQIPFYDVGTAGGIVTPQALYNLINSLTAESSPATGDKLPLYDASAGQADAVTFGNLVGIGKMIMFGYTGNGTSGRTVTLTGINRCYLIMVQRVGTSGSDDYRYPFGIPMGGTGAQSAMFTDGQWFGGFSFGAQSAGSSQVLTINSTAAGVNANGASYRLVAFGTPV